MIDQFSRKFTRSEMLAIESGLKKERDSLQRVINMHERSGRSYTDVMKRREVAISALENVMESLKFDTFPPEVK